ncbi:MAG: hypothetical protein K8R54_00295 [Bacteroidales bacterium]|nr:hypothetical protein [Bacteroidales bacterium]
MKKSKDEMLKYAVQMRERGDTYRDMLAYIKRYTNDEAIIKEIISEVDSLEKRKRINTPERGSNSGSMISIIFGSIFLVSGVILIFFLWGKGFVSTIPFILIAIGIAAFSGKFG